MLRFHLKLIFLAIAFLVCGSVRAEGDVTTQVVTPVVTTPQGQSQETVTTTTSPSGATVEKRVVVTTTPPAAKEIIETPKGQVSCFQVAAGWNQDIWVPEHRVCQYPNQASSTQTGVAWVESYWACNQYTDTTCTKWEWKPGHWVKTFEVY